MKKRISIVTPCFNEERNIPEIYEQVKVIFATLPEYSYEHIFIDNASTDNTFAVLKQLSSRDNNIKIIKNTRNFGPIRSPFHGLLQAKGDAVIFISADLQEPPHLIINFLKSWEKGYKIVAGIKTQSQESSFIFFLRKLYYKAVSRIAEIKLVKNFHGFGLYDKKVIQILRTLNESYPYLRGLVSELGFEIAEIPYTQQSRTQGKSKANIFILYDWVMLGITSHSKLPIRIATMLGFFLSFVSFIVSIVFLLLKIIYWSSFTLGTAPLLIGLFFFSSIQLLLIGLLGEYIISINTRVMNRPLVIEAERINFNEAN